MIVFLGALCGLVFAVSVLTVITGLVPRSGSRSLSVDTSTASMAAKAGIDPRQLRLIVFAMLAGFVVFAFTGWFAPALIFGGGVWLVPHTMTTRATVRRDRERLRALASWIEIIRDLLGSGAGIEDALVASQRHTGKAIAVDVAQLVVDTQLKGSRPALLAFGESFANPVADEVIWALVIAMDRSSAAVSEVIGKAAARTRERVATQEKLDAKRSSRYTVVNTMVAMTFLLGAAMVALNPAYQRYYSTLVGQLVLTTIIFLQGGGFVALLRMGQHQAGYRLPVTDQTDMGVGVSA